MLVEFDSDQLLWQKIVRDVIARHCPASLIREVADRGADPTPLWEVYCRRRWTALTNTREAVELMIVLEELGRACDPTPYLATMTQFVPLVCGADPGVVGAGVFEGVSARRVGAGWELAGTARVLEGDRAERFAVVTNAGTFVIGAGRVRARRVQVFDPVLHVGEVSFDGVRVGESDRAHGDVDRARAVALTGLAATVVGACQRVLDLMIGQMSGVTQFGTRARCLPVVAHKAADVYVAVVRARVLLYRAALLIAANDPGHGVAAVMAKAAAGECQGFVHDQGVPLFGSMGFARDGDVRFALQRARAGELLLGDTDEHRATIVREYHAAVI